MRRALLDTVRGVCGLLLFVALSCVALERCGLLSLGSSEKTSEKP
jgi:hypothetical protein